MRLQAAAGLLGSRVNCHGRAQQPCGALRASLEPTMLTKGEEELYLGVAPSAGAGRHVSWTVQLPCQL